MLDAAGFQDVFVLRGGMVRWNEAGFDPRPAQAAIGAKEG
jgi:3-mercaptopyruvate sulfurtransferase SseA